MNPSKLLVRFGFYNTKSKEIEAIYKNINESERKKKVDALSDEEALKHSDQEFYEKTIEQEVWTGYPSVITPEHRRRWAYESYTKPVEAIYFWVLERLSGRDGFPLVEKIVDAFASAEQSSFWGQSSTRLGVQQDKVSQYLATIGKMIKDMFQLVRELRILDERLSYYEDSNDEESKSRESAEITLKGIYVDMAEGGSKNPSSVFGMAQELQFTTLPDLFFKTHPPSIKHIDEWVDRLDFNDAVKRVLKRKLRSFMEWKKHTHLELKNRKSFTLKYMRQHYDVIQMYLAWIRPYLRNISRLLSESMEKKKISSADIVTAFEGSILEVEFLARKMPRENKKYYACILANFLMRSRPDMSYNQEGYRHQGAIHMGKIDVVLRCYAWNEEQVENYKKMRLAEDFEMIGKIDRAVRDAMEGLGDEMRRYLKEAGEELLVSEGKKEETSVEISGSFLKNFFGTFVDIKPKKEKPKKPSKAEEFNAEQEKDIALEAAQGRMWLCYKYYKKAHGYLQW